MTENKRFVNIEHEIHLNDEWWCSAGGEHCAEVIATAINELIEENEQLQEQLSKQGTRIDFLKDENKHMRDLVNENKQLKKEVEQLKNKINTYHEGNKTLHKTLQRYKEKK